MVIVRFAQIRPECPVIIAMYGNVNHSWIIVERTLRRLSMMDVPVDDQDAFGRAVVERTLSSHGHIIEKAISVEFSLHGMMARWPDYGHTVLAASVQDVVEQFDGTADGQQGQFER